MKVLFIGNSHTFFNDMPRTFACLCKAGANINVDAVMLCHPGMTLEWHLSQYYELRYNLLFGKYDYCVIQQGAHPFPGKEETLRDLSRIIELCRKGGTKPVVLMTWAEKRFPEHQQIMIDTYQQASSDADVLLAPVGKVWQKMQEEHPEVELFWKDGEHASPLGDYLIACVLYNVITLNLPIGLPNIGTDFLKGMEIGVDKMCAIEDTANLNDELDESACRTIQETVAATCHSCGLHGC